MGKKVRAFAWGKISLASFIVWILSVISFVVLSKTTLESAMTRGGTYTSTESAVFLGLIVVGVVAFLAFCLSFFKKLWLKSKMLALLITALALLIPVGLGAFATGILITENQDLSNTPTLPPSFTGQEVFDAVNKYRRENGSAELILDQNVCNNLAQRYFDLKDGVEEHVAHKGFEEWYRKYLEPLGYSVSENYALAPSPEEAIKFWDGSPGHRMSVLDSGATVGCSYASEGYAILILGHK